MAEYTPLQQAAITRAAQYNPQPYTPANLFGMANRGYKINLTLSVNDVALIAGGVKAQADDAKAQADRNAGLLAGRPIATSSSNITIGTGPRTFSVPEDIANTAPFRVGDWVQATPTATPSAYVWGRLTAATPGTPGTLTLEVSRTNGAGTFTSWRLLTTGPEGPGGGSVFASPTDSVSGDLASKLAAGTAISLVLNNAGANESYTITPTLATQAEAEAGSADDVLMTPERTKQYIDAREADAATTLAGTDADKLVTPAGLSAAVAAWDVGFKNRVINGAMRIDQRNNGSAQTLTAGAALAYCVDRFYAFCSGANITVQRVAVNGLTRLRFTGAASNTGLGLGQRVEAANSADLAGKKATLQLKANSSSITTLNWAVYYASTTDSFGTLVSPTRTLIDSGSITINSTQTLYSRTFDVPSAATTGLEIVFTAGALLATQTLDITDIQLEEGARTTAYDRRPMGLEETLCLRRFEIVDVWAVSNAASATILQRQMAHFTVRKASTPTCSVVRLSGELSSTVTVVGTPALNGAWLNLTSAGASETGLFRVTANSEL